MSQVWEIIRDRYIRRTVRFIMNDQELKRCSNCGKEKDVSSFYRLYKNKKGLASHCKECLKERNRTPQRKKYNNDWQKRNKYWKRPNSRATKAKWARKHSKTLYAQLRNKVKRKWRTYKEKYNIVPKPCVLCGNTKVQAHHRNYEYPLRIVWACFSCHKKIHKETLDLLSKEINYEQCENCHAIERLKGLPTIKYPNLQDDICSLVKAELITMSRAREILEIKYMEDMRDIYNKYHKRIMGGKE